MTDPFDDDEPATRRRRRVRVIGAVLVVLLAVPIIIQAFRIIATVVGS